MDLHGLDVDTLALIIELQREDLSNIAEDRKGKHRAGEGPDSEHAFQLYEEELTRLAIVAADRRRALRGVAPLVQAVGDAITAQTAAQHHDAPVRPPTLRLHTQPQEAVVEQTPYEEPLIELEEDDLYSADDYPVTQHKSASSVSSASSWVSVPEMNQPEAEEPRYRTCISCQGNHPPIDLVECPCGHEYCHGCLSSLFRASTKDESLFPPRCCTQPIPLDDIRQYLSPDLISTFEAKTIEFETPNRVYCHQLTCPTFIPPNFIRNNIGRCPQCLLETCCACKGATHEGDCPEDPGLTEVLRIASENGWQRCEKCGSMVELTYGCDHMTCTCKHEFCYRCGKEWKTCKCPQWDESRLTARAQELVARQTRGADLGASLAQAVLQRARQRVLRTHDCPGHQWKFFHGANTCERCNEDMPVFVYRCKLCQALACKLCTLNRL